jgi:hypothetical protein
MHAVLIALSKEWVVVNFFAARCNVWGDLIKCGVMKGIL